MGPDLSLFLLLGLLFPALIWVSEVKPVRWALGADLPDLL